jgi:hypothetical protein
MATLLAITTSYLVSGDFDTRNRYVRSNGSSSDLRIVKEGTFVISLQGAAGKRPSWRYSDGSYAVAYTDIQASGPISHTPAYELAKL